MPRPRRPLARFSAIGQNAGERLTLGEKVNIRKSLLPWFGCLAIAAAYAQQPNADPRDFSGIYRPAGLAVQPCGYNEWLRRSFETDKFCLGSDEGFPFSEQGLANWRNFSPIDDPVLRCRETFPRSAMRGRSMRIMLGEETTEIAYWFNKQWHTRTVHMNGATPSDDLAHTDFGYSIGRWDGSVLVVETTHTNGGPMFNDHKPSSSQSHVTERFWVAPDEQNLLMDVALDDPVNYTKPFLVNRQEWIWTPPGRQLSQTECTPSSIWAEQEDSE